MIRTVNEEPCWMCNRITNAYEPCIGRICPKCCAEHITKCCGVPIEEVYDPNLLTDPLIDHTNDIDAFLKEKK